VNERIELRAERVRVLVTALGEEPTLSLEDTFAAGLVPGGWGELLSDEALNLHPGDVREDVALAIELATVGQEIRARQWDALERVDALVTAGNGGPLPILHQMELAGAIIVLGWQTFPEEG